jgi:hypothetical protein
MSRIAPAEQTIAAPHLAKRKPGARFLLRPPAFGRTGDVFVSAAVTDALNDTLSER